ncbi:RNA-directed DNA polymerase, eukaryota [Tanacetum coccineum]
MRSSITRLAIWFAPPGDAIDDQTGSVMEEQIVKPLIMDFNDGRSKGDLELEDILDGGEDEIDILLLLRFLQIQVTEHGGAVLQALSTDSCFTKFVMHVDIVVKDKEVLINLLLFSACPLPSPGRGGENMIHYLKGSSTELFYIRIHFDEKIVRREKTPAHVYMYKSDMTCIDWEKRECLKEWDVTDFDFEVYHDLKDLDMKLGGFIHIRGEMGDIIYSYHVNDDTISLLHTPSPMLPSSHVSLWEYRFRDDHGETKCIDSKVEMKNNDEIFSRPQEAGGSSDGPKRRRTYIYREREEAEQRLNDDYFDDDEYEPKYPEEKFRRRSRFDATGRNSIGPILKCTSAIRQMAYDTSPDAFDEYLQIAERTSRECLDHFTKCIHKLADQKLWIWHAYFGVPGANNDLNVLYGSPLFDDEIADRAPECPFVVNGHTYRKCYYLADGIYPAWSTFVKTFSVVRDEKTLKFKRVQEAARKDIERAFEVLQDERFEVNLRDVFVNPAPNIVRDWVEKCDLHVRKTKELRDRKTHIDLRQDLVEHLWNNDDEWFVFLFM